MMRIFIFRLSRIKRHVNLATFLRKPFLAQARSLHPTEVVFARALTRIFDKPRDSILAALISAPLKQGVNEKWWRWSFRRYEISALGVLIFVLGNGCKKSEASGSTHNALV